MNYIMESSGWEKGDQSRFFTGTRPLPGDSLRFSYTGEAWESCYELHVLNHQLLVKVNKWLPVEVNMLVIGSKLIDWTCENEWTLKGYTHETYLFVPRFDAAFSNKVHPPFYAQVVL